MRPSARLTVRQILHPERFEKEEVLGQLRQTLLDAHAYHKKWSFWSGCSLGLTGALFAIPGPPNVPFYWNAFRSYSHYRATRGSHYLLLQLNREFPVCHSLQGNANFLRYNG